MRKKERAEAEITGKSKKKDYNSPKIEVIADLREITKGSTIGNTDAGGQNSRVPSDPSYP